MMILWHDPDPAHEPNELYHIAMTVVGGLLLGAGFVAAYCLWHAPALLKVVWR